MSFRSSSTLGRSFWPLKHELMISITSTEWIQSSIQIPFEIGFLVDSIKGVKPLVAISFN